ncbi:dihydroorotase [Beggiatoa leptomitoformis]|uniref:Dihydroorotase n=1 Tax=Beggiatoa leptomitoformis TaxID=288004 RepID=A0A2N9YAZ3_9GAMM|nr:dihydroorotase [Beggiatoa leptomitoformis]ALG67012.1 dihydroorotase [Beggiatoa leptomitoformis]AUI67612.1 dihydroorotase [Beggiatoa leptomitoformis]
MTQITLTQPDDWHLHVRDGVAMASVISATARCFARAVIMPNLKPPITTLAQAEAYRQRICSALPEGATFQPLMALYLTDNTNPDEIVRLKASEQVVAIKYYPAGATTNSESGVTDLRKVWHLLETMQQYDVPLLIHGEVTTASVDVFDREKIFIEHILDPIIQAFPALRIVLEHITTLEAVEYISAQADNIAATITAHHLLMNRNDLFNGGVRPHHYCLPILKREQHRQALLQAASSGTPKFFLGTDSAPHARHTKETTCGCAGMFTAPAALELYAEAFEQVNALDKLEGFASFYGADFYRLPRNKRTVTLKKQAWQMPTHWAFGNDEVVPLRAGETIQWQLITG